MLKKAQLKTTTIDISSFPKGNYVIKVATENSIGHSKIVKI
ncbi:T9SS type A sorting domain-containing protein [Brumimicrobium glaciale]|uniref:T9SS type A sorting domain-containing protein n=1 Tax=Brumimicrobium glaciale TaxID=200475 RepID=A0A4Q4KJG1_9FLAO|nr:T9SS type A sorting domain-containing protein [Brumimicrobium glaciale]